MTTLDTADAYGLGRSEEYIAPGFARSPRRATVW